MVVTLGGAGTPWLSGLRRRWRLLTSRLRPWRARSGCRGLPMASRALRVAFGGEPVGAVVLLDKSGVGDCGERDALRVADGAQPRAVEASFVGVDEQSEASDVQAALAERGLMQLASLCAGHEQPIGLEAVAIPSAADELLAGAFEPRLEGAQRSVGPACGPAERLGEVGRRRGAANLGEGRFDDAVVRSGLHGLARRRRGGRRGARRAR